MHSGMTEWAGRRDAKWYELDEPGEYWVGRVVSAPAGHRPGNEFGHIVGFGRTHMNEVNIRVLWEDGEERSIHPGNLTLH